MVPLMNWDATQGVMHKVYKPEDLSDWSGIHWHGNGTVVPVDVPSCGWQNELCNSAGDSGSTTVMIIIGVLSGIVILVLIASGIYLIKRYAYEAAIKAVGEVKVNWTNIHKRVILSGNMTNRHNINSHRPKEMATLQDKIVFITYVGNKSINLTNRDIQLEVKEMRELHHDNVNGFVGICTETPNTCILMVFEPRSSIYDIIASEDIKLTLDFKVSFVQDIALGMRYLHHGAVAAHGRLSSAMCVVNSRWTCKITGHGLGSLRNSPSLEELPPNKLLWVAPEQFHNVPDNVYLMKQFDVYSFGIIVQEIFLEGGPYCANVPEVQPDEIIHKVKQELQPPFRPILPPGMCTRDWAGLIQTCWHEHSDSRPSFDKIIHTIKRFYTHDSFDLVDNMIKRLEIYTDVLEEKVVERLIELSVEKTKVETLLCELLPHTVADKLIMGQRVNPETFDNVTLFFSDIVGFTRISAKSLPMQVVEMLNTMYTMFDDIAHQFDVYKVATIGDAYMVASGVPIRNGDTHAAEICNMAVTVRDAIQHFPIPHLPQEQLRMRIGIHSGPCVAGVTGIKMPRYLLFGDTVDAAAKMESGGEAMKIHISESTERLIRNNQNFSLESRGNFWVKGMALLVTYWLEKVNNLR